MTPYFRVGDRVRHDALSKTPMIVEDVWQQRRINPPSIQWRVRAQGAWSGADDWQDHFSLDAENAEVNFND